MSLPLWLNHVNNPTRLKELSELSANWKKLSAGMSTLTETDCLSIIVLELRGKKRPEIIGRVKKLFNRLRDQRELYELWQIHPGAGVRVPGGASSGEAGTGVRR